MHEHGGEIYKSQYKLDYSVNVNPLGTPRVVIEAAARGAELSAHYPDVACTELRAALADFLQVSGDKLIFGNGAAELIFSLILARRPKKILLPAPTFAEYAEAASVVDAQLVHYKLREEEGFVMGEDFLEALTPDIDMVFLCNPNNPTGRLVEKDRMLRILERCRRQDILLVVDECFNEFLDEPARYSVRDQIDVYDNLFILKAFTKIYAMAGLRLGYGICANRELLASMGEVTQPWSVSIPAQCAGVAALKETEYVKRGKAILREERAFLKQSLRELGFEVFDSQANYIFFKGDPELKKKCGEKGILIRDCSNYTGLRPGYFRVAVKLHEENVQLVKAMEEIING